MGLAFDAPLALLLLVPALALTLGLHFASRRRLGAGRRRVALAVRTVLLSALVFALAGFQLVLPVDRLATVFVVDLSDSVGNAGREDALAFLRETLAEKPDGDVAGIVAFGREALVERLPSDLAEIDRLASAPRFGSPWRSFPTIRRNGSCSSRTATTRPAGARRRPPWPRRRACRSRRAGSAWVTWTRS